MAKLRKFCAYRDLKRPYTRFSKYQALNYVGSRAVCKVVRFDMGDQLVKYDHSLHLVSKSDLQIRDNALESARQTSNGYLEKTLGKTGYFLQMRVYPHHIMRENPLAAGAGADRMSTGMAHNYGKPIGIAAQVFTGKPIITIAVNKENLELARKALKRASYKIPCKCTIIIEDRKKMAKPKAVAIKTAGKPAAAAAV